MRLTRMQYYTKSLEVHRRQQGRLFDMPLTYENLGLALWSTGRAEEAKQAFSECIRSVITV